MGSQVKSCSSSSSACRDRDWNSKSRRLIFSTALEATALICVPVKEGHQGRAQGAWWAPAKRNISAPRSSTPHCRLDTLTHSKGRAPRAECALKTNQVFSNFMLFLTRVFQPCHYGHFRLGNCGFWGCSGGTVGCLAAMLIFTHQMPGALNPLAPSSPKCL